MNATAQTITVTREASNVCRGSETVREIGYMARCGRCKSAKRLTGFAFKRSSGTDKWGAKTFIRRESWPMAECCGWDVSFMRIVGTVTETKCDDRCTSAKGHQCECSCGGKNHGAAA